MAAESRGKSIHEFIAALTEAHLAESPLDFKGSEYQKRLYETLTSAPRSGEILAAQFREFEIRRRLHEVKIRAAIMVPATRVIMRIACQFEAVAPWEMAAIGPSPARPEDAWRGYA